MHIEVFKLATLEARFVYPKHKGNITIMHNLKQCHADGRLFFAAYIDDELFYPITSISESVKSVRDELETDLTKVLGNNVKLFRLTIIEESKHDLLMSAVTKRIRKHLKQ